MANEHEHVWILVTNFGDTRLMRFCKDCPARQMLSPDDWHKELEQQLADVRADNATMRALLESLLDVEEEPIDSHRVQDVFHAIRACLADKEAP